MADYPSFTATDLSQFSGRAEEAYPPYTQSALMQATLLFKLATCLEVWPEDPTMAELAHYAVLSIADTMVLAQPYQAIAANPFTGESIGSYSYSKAQQAMRGRVLAGTPTGDSWFDLAVQRLGVCTDIARVERGSIHVFEDDLPLEEQGPDDKKVLGPADVNFVDAPFWVSREQTYDPNDHQNF